MMEYHI